MELKDISPESISPYQLENPFSDQNTPSLNEFGKGKTQALKKAIEEIRELITEREGLSNEIFEEGEKIKTEINNFIIESESNSKGIDEEDTREKTGLRQKKVDVSELQLNEKVGCWKDIALLKKELRGMEMELSERESRMNALNDIMGER